MISNLFGSWLLGSFVMIGTGVENSVLDIITYDF
jgi:hypothetical protein